MTQYRNSSINTLELISANLRSKGFVVGPIVAPEIPAVGGNPYIDTSATNLDILRAWREVGA